jgi:hypothetical protein
MAATLSNPFYALETSAGLLAQQAEFVAFWVQLRRQVVDNCPGCPGPPVDTVNAALTAVNEALRVASQAVGQIVAHEVQAGA